MRKPFLNKPFDSPTSRGATRTYSFEATSRSRQGKWVTHVNTIISHALVRTLPFLSWIRVVLACAITCPPTGFTVGNMLIAPGSDWHWFTITTATLNSLSAAKNRRNEVGTGSQPQYEHGVAQSVLTVGGYRSIHTHYRIVESTIFGACKTCWSCGWTR